MDNAIFSNIVNMKATIKLWNKFTKILKLWDIIAKTIEAR